MSTNMDIYDRCRSVPAEAQKQFNNGRFSGTDINPMWRIKKLTEIFGPSGIGWWTEDVKYWLEQGTDGSVSAFCSLSLRYVLGDKTSQPVHGIGGNVFVQKNKTSDEAFKMAYTDALSIAAKALGIGADIWFANDKTKYEQQAEQNNANNQKFDDLETLDDLTDVYIALPECDTLDDLKRIFGDAWKKTKANERPKLKAEYEKKKKELEAVNA